jgi:hypothetical protein
MVFRSVVALTPARPSWKNVSLRVPTRNVRDFSVFSVWSSNKHCSAQCAYATKLVGKDGDLFAIGGVSLNHIL